MIDTNAHTDTHKPPPVLTVLHVRMSPCRHPGLTLTAGHHVVSAGLVSRCQPPHLPLPPASPPAV